MPFVRRLLCTALLLAATSAATAHAVQAENPAMHAFVDALLKRMTLEEKAGQLSIFGADKDNLQQMIRDGRVGGTNGVLPGRDVGLYTWCMQQLAMQSRLKIPLWFMGDVAHGLRTTFPMPLALAASWDTGLVERVHRAAAAEATAVGVDWTFSPMIDISRDPRWGRVIESAGEDPYLGAAMALAQMRGFQGGDLSANDTMMATAKHFAGYGAVEGGRDYNSVYLPPREFRDVYLPPFEAVARGGIGSFMAAFTDFDGVPATSSSALFKGILRGEWAYPGLVVSDFDAVAELQTHGVAAGPAEAAMMALQAGIDIDLHSGTYLATLPALVRAGRLPETQVDAAVRRVLEAKYRLGLFDDAYRYNDPTRAARTILSPSHRALARKAARESMVLLKNRTHTLPLSRDRRIAVIGPLADSRKDLLGPIHAQGKPEDAISILAGIRAAAGKQARVSYTRGTDIRGTDISGIATAVQAARKADVAVLVLGESTEMTGEGNSRAHIDLPGRQLALARAVQASGTPVVVVLINGRPLALPWLHDHVDAILEAWIPGDEGGPAVAELLFGDASPSGRLPMTFPRDAGQLPIYYAHLRTGRPDDDGTQYWSHYLDMPNTPLYPFGYGLGYTDFRYGPVQLDRQRMSADGEVQVSSRVTNTGKRAGTTVVQLYIHDHIASVTPPVRLLKGFCRVTLAPGESRDVHFGLTPADLAFHRRDMVLGTEPGDYDVFVGGDATTTNAARFTLGSDD